MRRVREKEIDKHTKKSERCIDYCGKKKRSVKAHTWEKEWEKLRIKFFMLMTSSSLFKCFCQVHV